MGIDIWMYAEKKIDNKWLYLGDFEPVNKYEYPGISVKPKEIYYPGTNYSLYCILANYRNSSCDEEAFNYISTPKGLPNDLSKELKAWSEAFDDELESPSWLYLEELIEFNWNQTIVMRRMVDKKFAKLFSDKKSSFPFDKWPKEEKISYSRYCSNGEIVAWTETYAESVGKHFLDFLETLKQKYNPRELRLVFWFS